MNKSQLTGNIGLFYVCYELSRRGWHALPTIRNAKGADIVIVKGKKKLGIQVKTFSGRSNVPLDNGKPDASVDFWVIVLNINDDKNRKIFIIPQEHIRIGISECTEKKVYTDFVIRTINKDKKGEIKYWMQHKFLLSEKHNYTDAWKYLEDD